MTFKNLIILSILIIGCKVISIAPAKNLTALNKTYAAHQMSDSLYKTIITSSNKSYASYQSMYAVEDSLISDLATFDAARANSKTLVSMVGDIKKRFSAYEAYHMSKGNLNNTLLNLNMQEMDALWATIENSEINYK